jgi:hypothetical protein
LPISKHVVYCRERSCCCADCSSCQCSACRWSLNFYF